MELNIRVKALMDWFFGFDLIRANEVAIEIADELNIMYPNTDWDHIDGTAFFDRTRKALRTVEGKNPQLFR